MVQAVRRWRLRICAAVAAVFAVASMATAGEAEFASSPEGAAQFERRIRPLLADHCYACHSSEAGAVQAGLRLDTRSGIARGGDSGAVVVPGHPEQSLLIQSIRYEAGGFQMPPSGKLPDEEIETLAQWVRQGAPLPAAGAGEAAADSSASGIDFEAGRQHWSFQPPERAAPPDVRQAGWLQRPIDAFVLAELEQRGLQPSAPADRRTLIRRVYFDLIGLPPAPEAVERFVADDAPGAYRRLVDRLLASPHYGERWGRYWLDLARYSDKTASWLSSIAQAWLYRDWVVRALNADMPYDDFVRRQLATDLLPETGPEDIPALGFLGLSPGYWKELKLDQEVIKGTVAEEWEERIDALGRTFLGFSVACARCHDHKFDPISTEDYYALAGVLASTRLVDRPTIPEAEAEVVRRARQQVQQWQAEIEQLEKEKSPPPDAEDQIARLKQRVAERKRATPHYDAPRAHAVTDAALYVVADGPDRTKLEYHPGEPRDLRVHIRGNPSNLGEPVPRRFLTVLSDGPPQPFSAQRSGRRDLAEAIVSGAAPLSARVIVNRVWHHHFGRGLVETVSDFGTQGAPPTHPRLLDDLTARFIEHDWSIKWLHREIVLSAVYQQSSAYRESGATADPSGRWLWRMLRRRLDIEAWRDAMLAAAGTLDRRIGGAPRPLTDASNHRRTVYGRVARKELNPMLRLYDFPAPSAHSPARTETMTPLQQLFVLNGPLIQQQAAALARRVLAKHPGDRDAQIHRAYQLLFQRPPSETELRLGRNFLTDGGFDSADQGWPRYAQALLGSNEFLFAD